MTSSAGAIARRSALAGLSAAGLGFALFGPRGAKDTAGGRIVLDYWEKWTGHEGRAMQRVVDDFNASQNRILVRYLVTAGIDQKTLIAIAGRTPPDVVGLWNYNIPLYAECGAILPLDAIDTTGAVSIERYAAGVRPLITHPDASGRMRTWGAMNTCGTIAMYYNRALFRAAGLDPDRPPRSIPELDEFATKLDLLAPEGTIERAGFLHAEPGWWSWIWGYHFGGTLFDASAGRSLAASPEFLRAYEWLQSYPRRLGVDHVRRFRSGFGTAYDSPLNAFLAEKVAIVVQGPWLASVINAYRPELDYGVAPFPVFDGVGNDDAPVGLIDGDVLVIPSGVRSPEACMEFIAYTQRRDVTEFLCTAHFKNSPLDSPSAGFVANHPNRGVGVHNRIAASPRGFACPRTRTWPEFKHEMDGSMQRIWGLESAVDTELASVAERTQQLLDRAAIQRRRREGAA